MRRRHFLAFASAVPLASSAEHVRSRLRTLIEEYNFRGVSFALAQNTGPVTCGELGEMPPNTRLRFASLSKPLTAVAVMQLVEKGPLRIEQDIRKWVPEFRPAGVTLDHLLRHTSGIRAYSGAAERYNTTPYANLTASVQAMLRLEDLFDKESLGVKSVYSSYNYNLLGLAVERGSGMPYTSYVQQRVVQPAGLTSVAPAAVDLPRGYYYENGVITEARPIDVSDRLPSGGWAGTAEDAVKFARAFRHCRLSRRETVTEMLRAPQIQRHRCWGTSAGWMVHRQCNYARTGYRLVEHTGNQPGVDHYLGMTMEASWYLAILTNMSGRKMKVGEDTISPVQWLGREILDDLRGSRPPSILAGA
jgi:serine beta-lactamase-like protein LACTB, mitochondrial